MTYENRKGIVKNRQALSTTQFYLFLCSDLAYENRQGIVKNRQAWPKRTRAKHRQGYRQETVKESSRIVKPL